MSNAVKILKHFETPKTEGVYFRLVCLTGQSKGSAYFIVGKRAVLGRSEKADIKVLDLKSSREHAEIARVGNNFVITDLGSQNGIMINDLKVKQHALNDGDKLIIGSTVYKFSKIEVVNETNVVKKYQPHITNDDEDEEEYEEVEAAPKNKRMTIVLSVIIGLAIIVLFMDDEPQKRKKKDTSVNYKINQLNDPFAAALKQKKKQSKKNKQKLHIYFQRGLREFREGNFFRAISEFESARQWSPKDPLAKFYLRKTREALDRKIKNYFSQATRAEESLKYIQTKVSYCAVLRLLSSYPDDLRFKTADEGLRRIEKKLGMDEGELECSTKKAKK